MPFLGPGLGLLCGESKRMAMDAMDVALLFDTGYDNHCILTGDVPPGYQATTYEEEGTEG
ncbi:hypothetical protein LB505_004002 [Fusarium chuoi]|nr:hypothetical protein LB505_004002 [Fusarium chuoi]